MLSKPRSSKGLCRFQWYQKAASPRKVLGLIKGMLLKEINQNREQSALESASDLSSSGESDFFSTMISG